MKGICLRRIVWKTFYAIHPGHYVGIVFTPNIYYASSDVFLSDIAAGLWGDELSGLILMKGLLSSPLPFSPFAIQF